MNNMDLAVAMNKAANRKELDALMAAAMKVANKHIRSALAAKYAAKTKELNG